MTAKEYFNQAYRLDHRINSEIMEAAGLRELACGVGSPSLGERNNPNKPTDAPYARILERIWDMEERINAEIDKLVDLKAQISEVINGLENADERMVLRYRYCNGMSWSKIGAELYADRTTVYRWHNAALTHVVLPENPIRV